MIQNTMNITPNDVPKEEDFIWHNKENTRYQNYLAQQSQYEHN